MQMKNKLAALLGIASMMEPIKTTKSALPTEDGLMNYKPIRKFYTPANQGDGIGPKNWSKKKSRLRMQKASRKANRY